MMKRLAVIVVLSVLGGCTSHIVPLRPLQKVEVWVPDAPAQTAPAMTEASAAPTAPATAASTVPATAAPIIAATERAPKPEGDATATAPATAAATAPATQPGHMVVRMVDPNQTTRFVYNASYDNVWKQAVGILTKTGFAMDRADYRLGVMTTHTLPSAQIVEFWKAQQVDAGDSMENTINNQRRWVRLTISTVEGKPEFYEIAVRVLVERESNPTENIGGPTFVEGSGFGRNAVTLRSDYAAPKDEPGLWITLGHDPDLERKLLDALFKRI